MLRKGFLEKGHYMPTKIFFLIIEKNQERREVTVKKTRDSINI